MRATVWLAGMLIVAGCSAKRVHEDPIIDQGDRVAEPGSTVSTAPASAERERLRGESDELMAAALAECAPAICEAVVRGEVALGMNETQVMAATRTTAAAWSVRRSGPATVLLPRDGTGPRDAVSEVALVRLADGRVQEYAYRESTGVRLVAAPEDAGTRGRAAALAEALIREGDELAAAGDLERALDRYDRASVLQPDDPLLDYRIATVLDKALRPIEALIQYRLFLHRLELERIEARGEAAAKIAEAIALARERIIVLERRGG